MTQSFPLNPAAALVAMEIGIELEAAPLDQSIQSMAIIEGIKSRAIVPTIKMIWEQYRDNPTAIRRIVGDPVMDRIIHFYKMIA